MYVSKQLDTCADVISCELRDCVVFMIRNTDLVIGAMYIPPYNSEYYDDIYFKNLELLLDHFSSKHLIIIGDLNSRVGILNNSVTAHKYMSNSDTAVNINDKILLNLFKAYPNFVIINGLTDAKNILIQNLHSIVEVFVLMLTSPYQMK